jgi:hypothetical protein
MIANSLKLNLKTRVPTDTKDDDLPVERSSLNSASIGTKRLHSVIIPDRGLLAPVPRSAPWVFSASAHRALASLQEVSRREAKSPRR